jgi:peptide/nickel transport system ATP-binding protein
VVLDRALVAPRDQDDLLEPGGHRLLHLDDWLVHQSEMESAPTDAFFQRPAHPDTRRLLESVPSADGEIRDIPGEVPSLIGPPPGGRFHPRCDYATPECRAGRPVAQAVAGDHRVRCYHPLVAP